MTPYAYIITTSRRNQIVKPTIESVLAYLRKTECPAYTAISDQPVVALFPDETEQPVDLTPYTEPCEVPSERVAEIEKEIDEVIERSEKRYAEMMARLKPGERPFSYSGQQWWFKKDRPDMIESSLKPLRVRWRE